VKSIQFTVSWILFPIVAGREFLLVVLAATGRCPKLYYITAALWPIFFYPTMVKQLLKQRRKHFEQQGKDKKKQIKAV
jgi:hypothetical protein